MADPLPYRARAMHDGTLLGESDGAVREDVPDEAPRLWFPRADVDVEALDPGLWQAGGGELADHVAFDHEKVELTLVDGDTTTRFPTWGDAADLIEVLDVRPEGELRFTSAARADWRRPVVEASQLLGQAIVAAGRHAPGRRAVHASMVFPRAADARRPRSPARAPGWPPPPVAASRHGRRW